MISAANNKESILPQHKKKGDVEGEQSSSKELFGSLLRSMQAKGQEQSTSASEGKAKAEGKEESTEQQSASEQADGSLIVGTHSAARVEAAAKEARVSAGSKESARGESTEDSKPPLIDKLNGKASDGETEKLVLKNIAEGQVDQSNKQQADSAKEGNDSQSSSKILGGNVKKLETEGSALKAENKSEGQAASLLSKSETAEEGTKARQGKGQTAEKSVSLKGQQKELSKAETLTNTKDGLSEKPGSVSSPKGKTAEVDKAKQHQGRSEAVKLNGERISIQKNESETTADKLMRLTRRLSGEASKKESVASSETKAESESNKSNIRSSNEQKKVLHNAFAKGKGTTPIEKSIAAKGLQVAQGQKKDEKKRLPSFANRELRAETAGKSGAGQQGRLAGPGTFKGFSLQGFSTTHSASTADQEFSLDTDKMVWKEHSTESSDAKEGKGSEQGRSSQMKLGQMSVSNMSVRRKIMPELTQKVQQAAAKAKQSPETWQKHNFVLDDGKKIHLSARQVEGVLQLKLGSLNSDLNRLLQQYQQQIKDHLKQECGTDIDLQLENNQEQEMSGFFDNDSSSSGQRRRGQKQFDGQKVVPQQINKVLMKSVRNFGYNQMEWTA